MKKIAITPHVTRGEEVIKILESLGGVNADRHKGNLPIEWESAYYIYMVIALFSLQELSFWKN